MSNEVSEQAAQAGDVQAVEETGQSVSVTPKENAKGTAVDKKPETPKENKDSKDWRKSDEDWQNMAESAKKGEDASATLQRLKEALGLEEEKEDTEVDVVAALQAKIETLEIQTAKAEWEKSHPDVNSPEYREEWNALVEKKGHLVKSGDLTYDDLHAILRKSVVSEAKKELETQELNVGSVPVSSKTNVQGEEIDPLIYEAMRKVGYSDEQIKESAA